MYRILKKDGMAKRAELTTVYGTVQTPLFMNVCISVIIGAVFPLAFAVFQNTALIVSALFTQDLSLLPKKAQIGYG